MDQTFTPKYSFKSQVRVALSLLSALLHCCWLLAAVDLAALILYPQLVAVSCPSNMATSAEATAITTTTAKALSRTKVVADAQEKTKGYLGRIEAAVDTQCIEESHLDQQLVGHGKRTVGKVRSEASCTLQRCVAGFVVSKTTNERSVCIVKHYFIQV